jgi:hypothetical protein
MKRIPLNAEIDEMLKQHGFFKGSRNAITPNFTDPLSEKEQSEQALWQLHRRPEGQPVHDRHNLLAWIKESSNYWQIAYHERIVGKGCLDDGLLAEFLSKSPPGSPPLPLAE